MMAFANEAERLLAEAKRPLPRMDPIAFRDGLRKVWDVQHGAYAARAVITFLGQVRDSMAELRAQVGEGSWPLNESSEARSLRGWDRAFRASSERLDLYKDEIPPCWGPGPDCWTGTGEGQTEEQWLQENVIGPSLYAKFGEDMPGLGLHWPPVAEAEHVAQLWNQLIEVEALRRIQRSLSSYVGEWLVATQRQLEKSAPGEAPTVRDAIDQLLADLENAAKKGWGAVKVVAAVTAAAGTLVIARALYRRRKTS